MRNTKEGQISAEDFGAAQRAIVEKGWWQGSVISAAFLPPQMDGHQDVAFWVIASQTCNLYNVDFQAIPVFELVAASQTDAVDSRMGKGIHPRILDVQACATDGGTIALRLDIQKRWWLPRNILATIPAPVLHIHDAWQDTFVGWMARSYTRAALPDAFNDALRDSRIKDVIENKLTRRKDSLYGIYLSIAADSDEEWGGVLGEMPPPYVLGIVLVTNVGADPINLCKELVRQLFDDKVPDPGNPGQKVTRADLAKQHGIRIIKPGIEAKSISAFTVLELQSLIRYTFVDYLSDSSVMAE